MHGKVISATVVFLILLFTAISYCTREKLIGDVVDIPFNAENVINVNYILYGINEISFDVITSRDDDSVFLSIADGLRLNKYRPCRTSKKQSTWMQWEDSHENPDLRTLTRFFTNARESRMIAMTLEQRCSLDKKNCSQRIFLNSRSKRWWLFGLNDFHNALCGA